jgi:hypothetical protein
MLITNAPPIADKKLVITKPVSNKEVIQRIIPLIMKVNIPRVNILTGRVKNNNIGFIKVFSTPKITAARSKSLRSLKKIPLNNNEVTPSAKELINHLIIK